MHVNPLTSSDLKRVLFTLSDDSTTTTATTSSSSSSGGAASHLTERRRSSHRDSLTRRGAGGILPQRLVSQDSISEEGGGFVPPHGRFSSRPYWATANISSNSSIDSDRRRSSTETTSRSIYSNRSR